MTVIDLPRNMLINFPHLLADVNVVVVVTELTLAAARDTIRILSWLKTNSGHAQVVVVANKYHASGGEITRPDFEASIERKLNYLIPFDLKAASHAAKLGQTFSEANRSGKAGAAVRDIAEAVRGVTDVEEPADAKGSKGAKGGDKGGAKGSLLGKIKLGGLLSKKDKAPA